MGPLRLATSVCLVLVAAACDGRLVDPDSAGAQSTDREKNRSGMPAPEAPPPSGEEQVCCLAGCGELFRDSLLADVDDAKLAAATLRVCRNASCLETALADIPFSTYGGAGKQFVEPSVREQTHEPLVAVTISARETPTAPRRLHVTYDPWRSNDYQDGDVYELTLKSADGAVIAQRRRDVRYALSQVCCSVCASAILVDGP